MHGADTLRAQLGPTAAELARLAPEIEVKLGVLAPSASLPPGDERLRLFDNIARFLRSLARDHGLLVFLDDLHWADRSTLLLLHYLLRHLRSNRLLVVVAYREMFGQALFGDREFFSEDARCTLTPIQHKGSAVFGEMPRRRPMNMSRRAPIRIATRSFTSG